MGAPFLVPTSELFRRRGARHRLELAGPVRGVALSSSQLTDDDVIADLTFEAQGAAIMVTGTATGRWRGECRRCLAPTAGEVQVELREVFEPHAVEGETYPLGTDDLDVEPALREALALALPLAPLCDEACAGPDPDAHPVQPEDDDVRSPRGAADHGDEGAGGDEGDEEEGMHGRGRDPRWAVLDTLRFDR